MRFQAWGRTVDIDELLPPRGGPRETAATSTPARLAPSGTRPFIQRLQVEHGELQADDVLYTGQHVRNLRAIIAYDSPVLRVGGMSFQAWGGTWSASGTTTLEEAGAFALGLKITEMRVEDLTAAFSSSGETAKVFGVLDGEGEFRGKTHDEWTRTLQGSGHVTIREGAWPSFNVLGVVIRAVLGLLPPVVPGHRDVSFNAPNTFERLDQTFRVDSGRVRTDDLSLITNDFRLTGRGSFGVDSTLAYDCSVTLTAEGAAKLIAAVPVPILRRAPVKLPPIPVTVTGTFEDPAIRPDVSGIPRTTVRALVGGLAGTLRETIGGVFGGQP